MSPPSLSTDAQSSSDLKQPLRREESSGISLSDKVRERAAILAQRAATTVSSFLRRIVPLGTAILLVGLLVISLSARLPERNDPVFFLLLVFGAAAGLGTSNRYAALRSKGAPKVFRGVVIETLIRFTLGAVVVLSLQLIAVQIEGFDVRLVATGVLSGLTIFGLLIVQGQIHAKSPRKRKIRLLLLCVAGGLFGSLISILLSLAEDLSGILQQGDPLTVLLIGGVVLLYVPPLVYLFDRESLKIKELPLSIMGLSIGVASATLAWSVLVGWDLNEWLPPTFLVLSTAGVAALQFNSLLGTVNSERDRIERLDADRNQEVQRWIERTKSNHEHTIGETQTELSRQKSEVQRWQDICQNLSHVAELVYYKPTALEEYAEWAFSLEDVVTNQLDNPQIRMALAYVYMQQTKIPEALEQLVRVSASCAKEGDKDSRTCLAASTLLDGIEGPQVIVQFLESAGLRITSSESDYFVVVSEEGSLKDYGGFYVISQAKETVGKQAMDGFISRVRRHYRPNTTGKIGIVIAGEFEISAQHVISAEIADDGVVIVPLTFSEIYNSVRENTSESKLRQAIHLATGQEDLYLRQSPITDPADFYGRRDVLDALRVRVDWDAPIGVFGILRIGKTSVLRQMQSEKFASKKNLKPIVAYIDMSLVADNSDQLLGKIMVNLLSNAKKKGLIEPKTVADDYVRSYSVSRFKDDLESLRTQVPRAHARCKPVLILDEIDTVLLADSNGATAFRPGISEAIHEIVTLNANQNTLTPVFCGKRPDQLWRLESIGLRDYFLERLTPPLYLTPMSRDDCSEMIVGIGASMNVQWTPEAVDQIFQESGGHPLVARSLCSRVWRDYKKEQPFGVKNVRQATESYINSGGTYFDQLGKMRFFSESEMRTLRLIARSESTSISAAKRDLEMSSENGVDSLNNLGLLTTTGDDWSIRGSVFRRWLLNS